MLGVIPVSQTVIVGNKDGNPIDQTLKLDSPNLIKGTGCSFAENP